MNGNNTTELYRIQVVKLELRGFSSIIPFEPNSPLCCPKTAVALQKQLKLSNLANSIRRPVCYKTDTLPLRY